MRRVVGGRGLGGLPRGAGGRVEETFSLHMRMSGVDL
jgi:hypothetical protein